MQTAANINTDIFLLLPSPKMIFCGLKLRPHLERERLLQS